MASEGSRGLTTVKLPGCTVAVMLRKVRPSSDGSQIRFPRLRNWCPSLFWQAVAGLVFGYFVLHPVSMVVFHWLDPRIAAAMPHSMQGGLRAPVFHSFELSMLPMALVFAVIGALITTFYGHHRLTLTVQRDRLAEQTERLRQYNAELARLELANRRTTQFMAHDFKTSIGCVGGFAGELLEKPSLSQDRDLVDALVCIRRQSHRMMGTVTDLLELARVREGGVPQMESISLSGLLEEAVSDFSLPAHAKQIALGKQHRNCPSAWGDPRLLRRVLCNLISNAVKHNGPETHVSLDAQMDESGRQIRFACWDDGTGIPTDILPSIFTEFTTAGDASGGSTGLGLAFCKSVVEAHNGRIWCESSPQGARFFFTIPLEEENHNGQ